VRFLGYRDDVPDLLKAADLFVMPSLSEGMCSSLVDAMFARTPIVTTAAGGIAEVVGKSPDSAESVARIVPERDPGALAAAIVTALDARESLGPMVDRALARAERLFTADRMVEETLAVYRELLGE
jgi:glycosyltransferase involved in cell wall biosynthesis